MRLKINFLKAIEKKLLEFISLTKLEKIALAIGFAMTVSFYVYYISSQKFHNFLINNYKFLIKWHDRTIFFPHFWIWQDFNMVLAAIYLVLPFSIIYFLVLTSAEFRNRRKKL